MCLYIIENLHHILLFINEISFNFLTMYVVALGITLLITDINRNGINKHDILPFAWLSFYPDCEYFVIKRNIFF